METPSSIFAWEIPGAEKPGGLQSMGLQSQTQLLLSLKVNYIILNHYIFNSSFKLPRTVHTFQKTCTLPILLWVQKVSVGSPVFLKLGHCQNCHTIQSIITMLGLILTLYSLEILDQVGQKTKQKTKRNKQKASLYFSFCWLTVEEGFIAMVAVQTTSLLHNNVFTLKRLSWPTYLGCMKTPNQPF